MTAPSTLPAEVQAIVADLCHGPSTLHRHENSAINAAFDHGVIEVDGLDPDPRTRLWRTRYSLRGRTVSR